LRTDNFCIAGDGLRGGAHAEALTYEQNRIETFSAKYFLNTAGIKMRTEKVPGSISSDAGRVNNNAFE
jgi:hypothetical protein